MTFMLEFGLAAAFISAIAALNFVWLRAAKNGKWHPTGVETMRRWRDGKWEYRPMTETEYGEHYADSEW